MEQEMKELIKELTYSDKVAEDFIKMVSGWKDALWRPVLIHWKQRLDQARQEYKRGKISKGQLAKVEEDIVKKLRQRVMKEIGSDEEFFDLADVIKHRHATCLGYSQLVYILCKSIGLSVNAIEVIELMTPGPLPAGCGHMACIVRLTDGKTMMVDAVLVSKPFELEREFAIVGNYLELKNKNNPLGIYRKIQILNQNGLIADIYNSRGVDYAESGQYSKAITDYTKAIKLNPRCAKAYNNRGVDYGELGQYSKAITDYTKAIKLNPRYAKAYNNRGLDYAILGKTEEAKKDLLKAVELNPKLKAEIKKLSDDFKLNLKFD